MGLFNGKRKTRRDEKKAFRQIVRKKTTQAARQAYEEEAIKVARERARAKARRPTVSQSLVGFAKKRIAQPQRRRTTVRRLRRRTRTSTPTKRKTRRRTRKSIPIRRIVRKAPAPTQTPPTTLNELFGGS